MNRIEFVKSLVSLPVVIKTLPSGLSEFKPTPLTTETTYEIVYRFVVESGEIFVFTRSTTRDRHGLLSIGAEVKHELGTGEEQ